MGRILPTVVVLALLGCTAAAFAVTENLKLERSPISDTHVSKWVAPDSLSFDEAGIGFFLRKPDRLTVEIVNGNDDEVRALARNQAASRGAQQFTWDGRDDANEVVPDGTYRPRVHLAREHRTILMPNRIRMDATPPRIGLVSVRPRVLTPDTGAALVRIRYRTSEHAKVIVYVDGEKRGGPTFRFAPAGKLEKFDWRGAGVRSLAPGAHRIRLRAIDLATNLGPPSGAISFVVRYVELRPLLVRVKTGRRFGFRVLNAKSYSVHLGSLHARRSGPLLILRAPEPGRYVLRVNANGHVARALVVVTP